MKMATLRNNGKNPAPSAVSRDDALPDHVSHQLDTIAVLQARAEHNVSLHQRAVETVTAFLGRPLFLNLVLAFVGIWVLVNLFLKHFGAIQFDQPPFFWLQGEVSLGALLLTIVILITQNRQSRLAERRAQLDLQVNLLAEQKIAKLIALVEELRRDLPTVRDRVDPEAEAMAESADPHAVLEALEEKMEQATKLVQSVEEMTRTVKKQ